MGKKIGKLVSFFLPILLAILTTLFSIYPIIKGGVNGAFFSIDPDVHYLSNSIQFLKSGFIQYIDHPGTPTIVLYSLFLFPFGLYVKLFLGLPFSSWVFDNYQFVFFCLRIVQSLILGAGVYIFLKTIIKFSNSFLSALISWLLLLSFSQTLFFGSYLSSEPFSLLIVSIWLFFIYKYLEFSSVSILPVLSVISGFAVANKFTNIFLVVASILLSFFSRIKDKNEKFLHIIFNFLLILFGFSVGTCPIGHRIMDSFRWLTTMIFSTEIHGGGKKVLFDLSSYLNSARTLRLSEPIPFIAIIGIFVLFLYFILIKKIKNAGNYSLVFSVFLIGILMFAKLNLSHYQFINYIVIIFLGSLLLKKTGNLVMAILVIILVGSVNSNIRYYYQTVTAAISKTSMIEKFIKDNPAHKATVWEWGRSKDFAILWSRGWANGLFTDELNNEIIPHYQLCQGLKSVEINGYCVGLNDFCWDNLYIQKVSLEIFKQNNPNLKYKYEYIKGSDDMYLVRLISCR